MTLRSTCWPLPPLAVLALELFKLAVLSETKRRPLTRVSVRCEPKPYRSTKFCATPKPDCVLAALEGEAPNAGSSLRAEPTSK